jgi:homoserine acetyltransferase
METPLWKVSVASIFGAIGALLGGLLAFQLASQYQNQFTRLILAKIVSSIF